jgi:transcriptional regulator with XRE-family HTH domain
MSSIANMPTRAKSPTPESLRIRAALDAVKANEGRSQKEVAELVGTDPSFLGQWSRGERPVPPEKAVLLADALRLGDPGLICKKWQRYQDAQPTGNVVPLRDPEAPLRPELVIARLENDVQAMTYAINSLFATMIFHRPAEAQAVAAAIRKTTPPKYRDVGFVAGLLRTLDKASKT